MTLLCLDEVMRRTNLPRMTLLDAVKAGTFPEPTKINRRRIAWSDEEVEAWIRAKLAERG